MRAIHIVLRETCRALSTNSNNKISNEWQDRNLSHLVQIILCNWKFQRVKNIKSNCRQVNSVLNRLLSFKVFADRWLRIIFIIRESSNGDDVHTKRFRNKQELCDKSWGIKSGEKPKSDKFFFKAIAISSPSQSYVGFLEPFLNPSLKLKSKLREACLEPLPETPPLITGRR